MEQSVTTVTELAANLDDTSGEIIAAAVERLISEGALDVWTMPIGMKKGRPAIMLCVLCVPGQEKRFASLIIQLTGTFGVRYRQWDRIVLERRRDEVQTEFGPIGIKVGLLDGNEIVRKCEYEDAKTAADKAGVNVRVVMNRVQAAMNSSTTPRETRQ